MEWNVFLYDINKQKIIKWNVFKHNSFSEYVSQHLRECKTKQEFAPKLFAELRYYFWGKCEYEVLIADWISCEHGKKVDVFEQVTANWFAFLDYVWDRKE